MVACLPAEAGGHFQIQINGKSVGPKIKVASTGSWIDFAPIQMSPLDLPAGKTSLRVRSFKANSPLMNLRSVRLSPLD